MERESFVFYRSFYKAIKKLSDKDLADSVRAICAYALDDQITELEGVPEIIFDMAKPQIDANIKRRACGEKGGRPKKKTDGFKNEKPTVSKNKTDGYSTEKPNVNVNENVNVNANENENVNENVNANGNKSGGKPQRVFVPPTLDEVKDYCWERNNHIDPQAFIDFYSAKGWMIGKNKMKDWKAAIRTWEQRNNTSAKGMPTNIVDNDFFKRKMEGL